MKVTFCLSPLFFFKQFSMSSRVLTSNLVRDNRIDTKFNYSIIECNKVYNQKAIDLTDKLWEYNNFLPNSIITWKEWVQCFLAADEFKGKFVDSFKTDTILLSCSYGHIDYPFVVEMLNRGFRVVLGGANFRYPGLEPMLKDYLKLLGVKEKNLKNVIIISGLVDLTTDLHYMIQQWKSVHITENDFSTLWDCNEDYLQYAMGVAKHILDFDPNTSDLRKNFAQSIFIMNNRCWWGKCKFCTYWRMDKMIFDKGISPQKMADNVIKTNEKFGSNQVYFANDYFVFNKKNVEVLEILKEHGQKVTIFGGIKLLQNKKYIDYLNKYISFVKIGLEAGTTFALDYVDKGYTAEEAETGFKNLAKWAKKDLQISWNMIVDLPQKNREGVVENYVNAAKWKKILIDAGLTAHTTALSFCITNLNKDDCIDNNFIRQTTPEKCTSGRVYLFEILRKLIDKRVDRILWNNIVPYDRYDIDGNLLPSDMDIVAPELVDFLLGNWGWGDQSSNFKDVTGPYGII